MAICLLDTNIVSFIIKRHTLRYKYRSLLVGYRGAVSFQTVAELEEGALAANWGTAKRLDMERYLQTTLIYHSDEDVVRRFAEVRVARRRQPISVSDAWIAATALAFGIELVTHNPGDFHAIPGLTVVTAVP